MESEATQRRSTSSTVMASIDRDEVGDRFIIADVSRDDAWLSIQTADARSLTLWR